MGRGGGGQGLQQPLPSCDREGKGGIQNINLLLRTACSSTNGGKARNRQIEGFYKSNETKCGNFLYRSVQTIFLQKIATQTTSFDWFTCFVSSWLSEQLAQSQIR